MSEQKIIEQLQLIDNSQPCAVTFTDTKGKKHLSTGRYVKQIPPQFALEFNYGDLPINIDLKKLCPVSTTPDKSIQTISCTARIVSHKGMTVEFFGLEPADPAILRQFFRVNIRTGITVLHRPELQGRSDLYWSIEGQTVDISRTGALAILADECPHLSPLVLLLELPDPHITVQCLAHIVRIKRLTRSRWLTAFHFDQVKDTVADAITANCFAEQRRQIRNNIETAD